MMRSTEECGMDSILDRPEIRIPIIFAYITVFLICLIGNSFTILVICAHRSMRTATNFFLVNLAIADLLVAIFCICQNMFHVVGTNNGRWIFGGTMCKLYAFVLHLVPCTGIGILVCVSVEKYIAVLHPLLALKVLTPRFRILLMASIWAVSLMFNLPYYVFTDYVPYKNNVAVCTRRPPNSTIGIDSSDDSNASKILVLISLISTRNMVSSSFVLWYCIPLIIIVFLYTRIGLVLWHSAPLRKLTQTGALRTNSNETSTIMSAISSGKTKTKRSATHPPPTVPSNIGVVASNQKKMPIWESRRSNSANSPSTGDQFALTHIRVAARLCSETIFSDSGQNGSDGRERDEVLLEDEDGKDEAGEDGQRQGQGMTKTARNNEEMLALAPVAKEGTAMLGTPNGTLLISTVESRKKVIRLLIAIVSSFAILTLPHHVRLVYTVWTNEIMCINSFEPLVQPITYLLLFLSSSCNPFLYAFMSRRFRSAIGDIFKCRTGRMRRKSVRTQNSDVVCCTTTLGGVSKGGGTTDETVALLTSSLSRLNSVTGPAAIAHNQSQIGTAGSERNLLLEQQPNSTNQRAKLRKKEGQNSFGGTSAVCGAARRHNGNIAVVYRKGSSNRP